MRDPTMEFHRLARSGWPSNCRQANCQTGRGLSPQAGRPTIQVWCNLRRFTPCFLEKSWTCRIAYVVDSCMSLWWIAQTNATGCSSFKSGRQDIVRTFPDRNRKLGCDNLCHRLPEAVSMRLKRVAALTDYQADGRVRLTAVLGCSIIEPHGRAVSPTWPETARLRFAA
jgi:hypothetical protein